MDEVKIIVCLFKFDKSRPRVSAPLGECSALPPSVDPIGEDRWGRCVGRGSARAVKSSAGLRLLQPFRKDSERMRRSHAPPSSLKGLGAASGFYFLFLVLLQGKGAQAQWRSSPVGVVVAY